MKIENQMHDTICALATPAGGAIGIIRMSGEEAISIAAKIFKANSGKPLEEAKTQSLHYGKIYASPSTTVEGGSEASIIDDVLVSVFRAPHSYTGENSIEISCHGSRYIISRIIELLIEKGCRQATPGEYTQRAFINGKMDLSQAEAVADLIASTNNATHRMAMSQLRGNFSNELSELREKLLHITSLLELELDFSDQDVSFADREQLSSIAKQIDKKITSLANSFKTGRAIKQGVPVAIIGKTNVGKSTLLNRLVGEERAIVSEIHGTTRDVIEDTVTINGINFRFIDTAGIRETKDEIERIGIERTYQKIQEAIIVLWVIDERPTEEELKAIKSQTSNKSLIIVRNKIDKGLTDWHLPYPCINISARTGENIHLIEQAIHQASDIPEIHENDVIITNARHYEALCRAHESITLVREGLEQGLSGDLLSEDLRQCITYIGEIVGGAISTEETLQSIFSSFCIGK